MEITEKERLKLLKKKDEMRKLSTEIIESLNTEPNMILIKKNMNAILNILSTLGSYSKNNQNLQPITNATSYLFVRMNQANRNNRWHPVLILIETWLNTVNSIEPKFTKSGINLKIPKLDLSMFKIDIL